MAWVYRAPEFQDTGNRSTNPKFTRLRILTSWVSKVSLPTSTSLSLSFWPIIVSVVSSESAIVVPVIFTAFVAHTVFVLG